MLFRQATKDAAGKAPPSLGAKSGRTPLPAPTAKAKTVRRPSDEQQSRMAQTFAQIVAVLMRDPGFRNLKIADLEWLVLPPVMAGQFRLAHATTQSATTQPAAGQEQLGGTFVPVAVALWARVSPQIDKGLSENLDRAVRLRASEWTSGDNIWLMAAAGHPRAVPEFLKQLQENEFKGKQVKLRARGPDGKTVIKTLNQ
jgi:cytolysin-activating lysine-acyltransferase